MGESPTVVPKNHAPSPAFHTLITGVFNPLTKGLRNYCISWRMGPKEARTRIISKFFSEWRNKIGPDLEPVMRLILPRLDKDRSMYGLKEKSLGLLVVKTLNLSKDSEDAKQLLDYKSGNLASVGNFSLVCAEIIKKRNPNVNYSDMTVDDVNKVLDDLSQVSKTEEQLPIFRKFYEKMNAEELLWIIRIILRYVQIGASEKTFFDNFHPDAMALYSVTSSLSKVCKQLWDVNYRLPDEQNQISVLSCFQPQMALYIKPNYDRIVNIMSETEGFYIEEKMDGERIQIHLADYGRKIKFFSRSAKDYTYLYGKSYDDANGTLSRHLQDVLSDKVESIILDGEMLAWNNIDKVIVPFGSLKSAVKNEQLGGSDMFPLFMAFDLLFLNGKNLVDYPLSERKIALKKICREKPGHFELIPYTVGHTAEIIGSMFEQVMAADAEGLVIKNPISRYLVGERNESWIKVKPDYLDALGEYLDVCIIGGYYGNGQRGGNLGSFLLGVRDDADESHPEKFLSLCRVGGGFSSQDLAQIRHLTKDKWSKYDSKRPPNDYLVIPPGGDKPDLWIKPSDSIVVELKGTQIVDSTTFAVGRTIRFPRFQRFRDEEKTWKEALTISEFRQLDAELGGLSGTEKRKFNDSEARHKQKHKKAKVINILGDDERSEKISVSSGIFSGLLFYVAADARHPRMMLKSELENELKLNGGSVTQDPNETLETIILTDRAVLQIRSILESREKPVFRPRWVLDSIKSGALLPIEPAYLFRGPKDLEKLASENADKYGDAWTRQLDRKEFEELVDGMHLAEQAGSQDLQNLRKELLHYDESLRDILFLGLRLCFFLADDSTYLSKQRAIYGGAQIIQNRDECTYIIVSESLNAFLQENYIPENIPLVSSSWIDDAWKGKLSLEELLKPPERYRRKISNEASS